MMPLNENSLRFASELEMLRQLVAGLPAMLIVVRRTEERPRFEYVSPYCLELTGYKAEDLVGKSSMLDLSYPGDIPEETSFQRMQDHHGVSPTSPFFSSVFRIVTASGQLKWVREMGSVLFDDEGKQKGICALVFDCTRSKALRLMFEEKEELLADRAWRLGGFIGSSKPMQALYQRLSLVAQSDAPVLITGETGVGKELAARVIHSLSMPSEPFVAVNCGGVNENLLENELFGHVSGAYTGAAGHAVGLLGQAGNGVLFLDEVGDIPLSMQVKLLRTLDGYGYIPVGGTKTLKTGFRLICATNRNIDELLANGSMRQDFYFRIQALPVWVPPLRQHREDIPLLIDYFLKLFSSPGKEALFPNHVRLSLQEYDWPGNVRELRNSIRRFLTLGELGLPLGQKPLPPLGDGPVPSLPNTNPQSGFDAASCSPDPANIKALREEQAIREALHLYGGHRGKAAQHLGIHLRTLYRKLRQYGLRDLPG